MVNVDTKTGDLVDEHIDDEADALALSIIVEQVRYDSIFDVAKGIEKAEIGLIRIVGCGMRKGKGFGAEIVFVSTMGHTNQARVRCDVKHCTTRSESAG